MWTLSCGLFHVDFLSCGLFILKLWIINYVVVDFFSTYCVDFSTSYVLPNITIMKKQSCHNLLIGIKRKAL
jgi:hypothetical protein